MKLHKLQCKFTLHTACTRSHSLASPTLKHVHSMRTTTSSMLAKLVAPALLLAVVAAAVTVPVSVRVAVVVHVTQQHY
jgi:hypothetical protein